MTADELREKYLEFFQSKKHKVVSSDSLVPKDDPTVLFTPAGMNQFKKQFLGLNADFTRATSSQRCLRTDDLEKVGQTDCHQTFFEMLGNFSFGDYFKEEAIAWAWEFLTEELKIPEEKLWVSVYKDDDQAYNIWKDKVKFPVEKIVKLGDHENFWPADAREKGPNGPCGPCSEIFFDLGVQAGCKKLDCTPACGCGRFIEIWNLVFTQFNREEGGLLKPLPQKNIDTGMGLERIAAVMQGVRSNFETDLFQPLVSQIKACVLEYDLKYIPIIYAVCDHIRAVVFSIFDGILPSNEARGYVVRKLIRKSILHLRELGIKGPFLYKLVPIVSGIMKKFYPELVKSRENIADIILSEEKNFIHTLNSSDILLAEKYQGFKDNLSPDAAGVIAFQLYDTYGIPLVLTADWLAENKIKFSIEAFQRELIQQKNRSKSGSAMQGDVFSVKELAFKGVSATKFVGYELMDVQASVIRIIKDDLEVEEIEAGDQAKLILDQTSFYPASGGQVGDQGVIICANGVFEVTDTCKSEKIIIHLGKVKNGVIRRFDNCQAKVDLERRLAIMRNHTATHLLQAALRIVLGNHVRQQGSFVAEDRLRFDFTHFRALKNEELNRVEEMVNNYLIKNLPVIKKEMSLESARQEGALAFFAEKYEDNVRVVSIEGVSKEFCGGTHLDFTGFIGIFKILSESSIASGIRRIEAVTAKEAYKVIKSQEGALLDIAEILKISSDKVAGEVEKKIKRIQELERELSSLKLNNVVSSLDDLLKQAELINAMKVIIRKIEGADIVILRKTADLLKQKEPGLMVVLGSIIRDQVFLIIATNIAEVDSSVLIKQIAPEIGGSGGGRKDFAQAGGTKPQNLERAFVKFRQVISSGK